MAMEHAWPDYRAWQATWIQQAAERVKTAPLTDDVRSTAYGWIKMANDAAENGDGNMYVFALDTVRKVVGIYATDTAQERL